jgi:predicted RNase H-like HicB family nuclease
MYNYDMTIETTTQIWREGKHYIAHALPLDVSSAGDTPESARAALREAINLFITTAREHGTLDDVLEECGYLLQQGTWVAPRIVAQDKDLVAV